jgi:hypothetical protein
MAVMFDLMKQIYALLNVKRMQVEFLLAVSKTQTKSLNLP